MASSIYVKASLVAIGLKMHILLSSSLDVTLTVTKVIFQDGRELPVGTAQERQSMPTIGAEHEPDKKRQVGFMSYVNSIVSIFLERCSVTASPIAVLTNKTLLFVEPGGNFVSLPNMAGEEKMVDEAFILRLSYEAFSLGCLHLLPENYRNRDSRYFPENMFESSKLAVECHSTFHPDDGLTCYLNPSQEFFVLKQITASSPVSSSGAICKILASQLWVLQRCENQTKGSVSRASTPIRLKFSAHIRPFHILIPSSLRSGCGFTDEHKIVLINVTNDSFRHEALSRIEKGMIYENSLNICPMIGSEKQMRFFISLVTEVISCFRPSSILNKIVHRARSPVGLLVYGGEGCGKSYLLETLRKKLKLSADLLVDISHVDCLDLRRCETFECIDQISRIFGSSKSSGKGRLILMDNIDALCPYVADAESFVKNAAGSLCAAKVSKKLESIFDCCNESNWNAIMQSQAILAEQFEHMNDLDSLFSLSKSNSAVGASLDLAIAGVLKNTTFVIATCRSLRSINPSLISFSGFRSSFCVPVFDSLSRLSLLRYFLSCHGAPLRLDFESDTKKSIIESKLIRYTEGMSPQEIQGIARKLYLRCYRSTSISLDKIGATEGAPIYISSADIDEELFGQLDETDSFVDWDSVYGLSEAKQKILSILHAPVIFRRLMHAQEAPVRLSRGILLYGVMILLNFTIRFLCSVFNIMFPQ